MRDYSSKSESRMPASDLLMLYRMKTFAGLPISRAGGQEIHTYLSTRNCVCLHQMPKENTKNKQGASPEFGMIGALLCLYCVLLHIHQKLFSEYYFDFIESMKWV